MKTKVVDRVLQFLKYKGIAKTAFEKTAGFSNGYFGKIQKGGGNIGGDNIEYILNYFNDLNPIWLMTGKGKMIKPDWLVEVEKNDFEVTAQLTAQPTAQDRETPKNRLDKNKGKRGGNVKPQLKPQLKPQSSQTPKNRSPIDTPIITIEAQDENRGSNVMVLNSKAAAGWPSNISSEAFYEALPKFQLPLFQFGDFALIETTGDSMHPTIYHGDWLLIKRITDLNDIKEGYVNVIITDGGVAVKRCLNRIKERQALALQSDNRMYTTYDVPISEVLQVWQVQMKWSAILRDINSGIQQEVNKLREDVNHILKKLSK